MPSKSKDVGGLLGAARAAKAAQPPAPEKLPDVAYSRDNVNGNLVKGPVAPPHKVNSALASDRMRALNADHVAMGSRPTTTERKRG